MQDKIDELIKEIIVKRNPHLNDDDQCDAFQDYEYIKEALEYLRDRIDDYEVETIGTHAPDLFPGLQDSLDTLTIRSK